MEDNKGGNISLLCLVVLLVCHFETCLMIENWLREFKRFCPSLVVEPYYGDQKTRAELRYSLEDRKDEFHVIVTTYEFRKFC